MKKIAVGLFLVVIIFAAAAVFAGSLGFSGTLTPGGATEPVVAGITTPNCNGSTVAFSVLYASYQFNVDAAGMYTITEPGAESAVYIYNGPFDPANPVSNCLAASNSNPINFSVALTPGNYTIVVIEDTFAQDGMAYNLSINGPGNIVEITSACPNPLPSDAVVYSVPLGAPAYFSPSLDSSAGFNLPAGTWYMNNFTADFAKVWIACEANSVYIPVSAVSR